MRTCWIAPLHPLEGATHVQPVAGVLLDEGERVEPAQRRHSAPGGHRKCLLVLVSAGDATDEPLHNVCLDVRLRKQRFIDLRSVRRGFQVLDTATKDAVSRTIKITFALCLCPNNQTHVYTHAHLYTHTKPG